MWFAEDQKNRTNREITVINGDQNKHQIFWKKSCFVDSGFVKTCDEFFIGLVSSGVHYLDHFTPPFAIQILLFKLCFLGLCFHNGRLEWCLILHRNFQVTINKIFIENRVILDFIGKVNSQYF